MCWLDKKSIDTILEIRDKFNISTFVETGTYKGINAKFHARNFKEVLTCDISDEYLKIARERLRPYKNVQVFKKSSPAFLKQFIKRYNRDKRNDIVLIFLDAHFYDPLLPLNEKWVIVNELKVLKHFKNCVIVIHDFDCEGWGHCVYDGEALGYSLIRKYLNPDFHLYTNTICAIYDKDTIADVPGIDLDEDTLDNIKYAWSEKRLTCRGILYCLPQPLNIHGLRLKK